MKKVLGNMKKKSAKSVKQVKKVVKNAMPVVPASVLVGVALATNMTTTVVVAAGVTLGLLAVSLLNKVK
jgi:hypothetical protein